MTEEEMAKKKLTGWLCFVCYEPAVITFNGQTWCKRCHKYFTNEWKAISFKELIKKFRRGK